MMFYKKSVDPHSVDAREENLKNREEKLEEKEKNLVYLTRQLEEKNALFQLEKDIFDRKATNWKQLDEARLNNYKQQTAFGIETAKLEARRDSLRDALKENDTLRNQLLATKDDQINNLRVLLTEVIKALRYPVEIKK